MSQAFDKNGYPIPRYDSTRPTPIRTAAAIISPAPPAAEQPKPPQLNSLGLAEHWSVTVEVDGERVLCISDQGYSGAHDLEPYEATIENCAKHLLSFIGAEPVAAPAQSVRDLISGIRSINRSQQHQIKIGDDDPCFWQRGAWVEWILELADEAERALSAPPAAQPMTEQEREICPHNDGHGHAFNVGVGSGRYKCQWCGKTDLMGAIEARGEEVMIETLLNNPRVLHQTADEADNMPEFPIMACTDSTGIICLSQEGRDIVINRASVKELCKLLRDLASKE